MHRCTLARVISAVALLLTVGFAPVALADEPDTRDPGQAQPYVVGGEPAPADEYPWMVALTEQLSGAVFCGGTLVAPDRVVTAAHCLAGREPASIVAIVGRSDLRVADGEPRSVLRTWVHPEYRQPAEGSDVAVLTLSYPVSAPTLPITDDPNDYRPGNRATILGWGYVTPDGPTSPELRRAFVPITTDADCAAAYREFDPAAMVCAGYPQGGIDACYGDSGGPLVVNGRLAGVTSWGSGCAEAGHPGVYTRVLNYADAVREQLRPQAVPVTP